ncbi:transcriptional regulator opi1 [Oleoguttula sp. CCFEE 5521]
MEGQMSRAPGSRGAVDVKTLDFPKVPSHELPRRSYGRSDITLPGLKDLLSPEFEQRPDERYGSPESVRSLPPIDVGHAGRDMNGMDDVIMHSPSDTGSVQGELDRGRARSVVSMDERIAAEALSGLSGPGFVQSPSQAMHPTMSPRERAALSRPSEHIDAEEEPLLQLFASKHPWVGGTINGSINGSMYVYNTTKHYSPRFVQNSATMVERNIATPLANTVGSVGRITGVEGGIRRYLDGRAPTDLERAEGKQPDRGDREDAMDIDDQDGTHRESMEILPAYRASKPPSYREDYSPAVAERAQDPSQRPPHNRTLSQRVFVMTSGLGVALSATSRHSLQACVRFLNQGAIRIDITMKALRLVLEQYDQARTNWRQQSSSNLEKGHERQHTPDHDDAAAQMASVIKYHSDEIWNTLKNVTNYISESTGAALPDNARHFVRSQVLSLPQRWQLVSRNQTGESETSRGAHRMIAFATEGLDMMSQVSQVVTATLDSAERWLERAGRSRRVDERSARQQVEWRNEKGEYERETAEPRLR